MTDRTNLERFRGVLLAEPDGGHAVVVPRDVRARLGGPARLRVRGTIAGVQFRSNIGRYGGIPYLGIHKATVEKAKLSGGQEVDIELEIDLDPR
jgi:uncharacterized protein DUF1905